MVWPPEVMKGQNVRILQILFFYHNFELRKSTSLVNDFTTIVFSSSRCVEWCIIWPRKCKKKIDLRSRSWPDPKRLCCMSFDPYWQEKRNGAVSKPVSCFYQKLLAKNEWWPLVTSYGHSWPFEDSPRFFFLISNLIYDTYSHNTARTERICWWLEGLEISPIDL